jgi:hypothetical protein
MRDASLRAQQDYAVRRLSEHICEGLPSKAYLDEYLAIYYFVLGHCRYMRDPRTIELVRDPALVAKELLAGKTPSLDCDDEAALICAMVLAVGGACNVVTVAFQDMFYDGQRQYSHVFAQALEPQSRALVALDPVAADRTDQMLRRVKAYKIWPVA